MRYRPFTSGGLSSSAVALSLRPGLKGDTAFRLVCAALECGINTFSFAAADEAAADALRRGVTSVGRGLLIVMLRLGLNGAAFDVQVRSALQASGVTFFDAILLDHPEPGAVSAVDLKGLEALRAARLARRLGLVSEGEAAKAYLSMIDFDVLALRYNVTSGWAERNMLKAAAQRGMSVIGYGHHIDRPETAAPPIVRGLARLMRRAAARDEGAYAFLERTHDWTPEQITLAYALTEPGLASVLVDADDPKTLEGLAAVVERELPAGVAAQIEMARFAAGAREGAA